jgi:MFS family permease
MCVRATTSMAMQMIGVAVGWQMYELTHSALALGFVGLAQFLPQLLLVFVVGHVADRYDRRTVARACQVLEALAMVSLCITAANGFASPALLYATVSLVGLGRAFEAPAVGALLPNLVPQALIPAGAARASAAQQTAIITGPAAGGLLYAWHPSIPYGVAGAMFALSAILMTVMRTRGSGSGGAGRATRDSVFAGLSFIRRTPLVLGAISLDLFAVLLGGATALLPIFARDILQIGPWGLGLLRTAPAVGALSLSLWFARHPIRRRAGQLMFFAVGTFGLSTIVFGLSHSFAISFAALVVRRDPAVAGRHRDPRWYARPGQRRQPALHRDVESGRRVRVRADGRLAGSGRGGRARRHRFARRDGHLVAAVPGAGRHGDPRCHPGVSKRACIQSGRRNVV